MRYCDFETMGPSSLPATQPQNIMSILSEFLQIWCQFSLCNYYPIHNEYCITLKCNQGERRSRLLYVCLSRENRYTSQMCNDTKKQSSIDKILLKHRKFRSSRINKVAHLLSLQTRHLQHTITVRLHFTSSCSTLTNQWHAKVSQSCLLPIPVHNVHIVTSSSQALQLA